MGECPYVPRHAHPFVIVPQVSSLLQWQVIVTDACNASHLNRTPLRRKHMQNVSWEYICLQMHAISRPSDAE